MDYPAYLDGNDHPYVQLNALLGSPTVPLLHPSVHLLATESSYERRFCLLAAVALMFALPPIELAVHPATEAAGPSCTS